jgi:hypothetical protein
VRAVGVDLVVEEAGVAKTSLYRHFRTKDDLIAAFLQREDEDFWNCWNCWNCVTELHKTDPVAELEAHLDWCGERVGRPNYRGCPQRLRVKRPDELAGQLSLLINGAFVSSQVLSPGVAGLQTPLSTLRRAPHDAQRLTRASVVCYSFTAQDFHPLTPCQSSRRTNVLKCPFSGTASCWGVMPAASHTCHRSGKALTCSSRPGTRRAAVRRGYRARRTDPTRWHPISETSPISRAG